MPVRPPADRQQGVHVAILLLDHVHLLGAAVDIVSGIGPRITREVLVQIRVWVGQDNLARGLDVQEPIENMSEVVGDQVLGIVFATINRL